MFFLEEGLKKWVPDSMAISGAALFSSDNGLSESFLRKSRLENEMNWTSNGRGCETEAEYTSYTFRSTFTESKIHVQISSYEDEERLYIGFGDFHAHLDFATGESGGSTIISLEGSPRVSSNWQFLSSHNVNGRTYRNVAKITLSVESGNIPEHNARVLYYAPHKGVLGYEQFDGVVWELSN